MKKDAICECGHSWAYHFGYSLAKQVKAGKKDPNRKPCHHWSGCTCEGWKEREPVDPEDARMLYGSHKGKEKKNEGATG